MGYFLLLAEGSTTTLDQWSNLSALGCLILCCIWVVTKGFPSLLQRYTEESERQRLDFGEQIKLQRSDFREELSAQRNSFSNELSLNRTAISTLSNSVDQMRERLDP
jgi:hypothetical protein